MVEVEFVTRSRAFLSISAEMSMPKMELRLA